MQKDGAEVVTDIDLSMPIVCERDTYKGEAYCIDCFSPRKKEFFYFYNSHGPFCSKKCYANFICVDYELLPKLDFRGSIR